MKLVIITGASYGIGAEFARQLDKEVSGVDEFWLVARREERMEELAKELSHPVRIFAEDVRNQSLYERLNVALEETKADIKILVNNAGYGISGAVENAETKETLGMVDVNCRALTAVTMLCLPFMKKGARILHMASSAAYLPQPKFAVYAASKAYVLSFSRALSEEIRGRGIIVTAVCPGQVETEFLEKAEGKNGASYSFKKYFRLQPEQVVEAAIRASKKRQTVVTPGFFMKGFRVLTKLVPHSWVLCAMRHL